MRTCSRHVFSVSTLVVFAALALGSGGKKKEEGGGSSTSTTAEATGSKPADKPVAKAAAAAAKKMGEVVNFEDSAWVVIEAKDLGSTPTSNNQFHKAEKSDDGKFILVKFSVKNKGKKDEMIFDEPKLLDSQGREFTHQEHQSFYVPKGTKTLGLEKIPVGLKKEFYSVFEVPKDAKGLKFQTRALEVAGDLVPIDIGL